ncbi:SusD/RagB family nutrient-binding outer membrane lipoprotein [Emticicia sp. W12TSBA100-4]|uniref:SusD/RagB family nutrient-binding outer membrane lipoprotein n=1 Tax=Emticicia sp. W12TSBA100-4 TaxID=3160965 RepID=UPI003305F456
MKGRYISIIAIATILIFMVNACQLTDLDINRDPNSPTTVSPRLLLPTAEYAVINATTALGQNSMGFAGMLTSADDYDLSNQSYNGLWNSFYQSMNNVEAIIKSSTNSPHYLGVAQALKAFAMGNFVDTFGDVPYSEAWQGNGNNTPKFDKDSQIYEDLIKLCDVAVTNLSRTTAEPLDPTADFMYGGGSGGAAKWIRFARTVKIKLLLNSRKGRPTGNADLRTALAAGGYITSPADDFTFNFSTSSTPVDGRHPWFQSAYLTTNNFPYISHQLMQEMLFNRDPRLDFYFYRQTASILDVSNPTDRGVIPFGGTYLVLKPAFWARWRQVFGRETRSDSLYVAGFFGRDRGDNTGQPLDGNLRTAPGAYPAGGLYSGRNTVARTLTGGTGSGNGIFPLLTSNNVKFYQIESILDGGGTGNARTIFEAAIREHIARVVAVGVKADPLAQTPTASAINEYVSSVLKSYDDATTNSAKLNVVMKQLWFCSWGQGQEIWNAMRRTGFPTTINKPIIRPPRQFALRLPYPSQEGAINPNATPKLTEVIFDRDPVFWDTVKLKWEF